MKNFKCSLLYHNTKSSLNDIFRFQETFYTFSREKGTFIYKAFKQFIISLNTTRKLKIGALYKTFHCNRYAVQFKAINICLNYKLLPPKINLFNVIILSFRSKLLFLNINFTFNLRCTCLKSLRSFRTYKPMKAFCHIICYLVLYQAF